MYTLYRHTHAPTYNTQTCPRLPPSHSRCSYYISIHMQLYTCSYMLCTPTQTYLPMHTPKHIQRYTYIYILAYTTYIYIPKYIPIYIYIQIYIYIDLQFHTCTFPPLHTHIYIPTYTHLPVYIPMYIYIYIYLYIHLVACIQM